MGIGKFLKQHKFSHRAWMYYELYVKNFRKKIKKYYSQYGEDKEIAKFFEKKKQKVIIAILVVFTLLDTVIHSTCSKKVGKGSI